MWAYHKTPINSADSDSGPLRTSIGDQSEAVIVLMAATSLVRVKLKLEIMLLMWQMEVEDDCC